MRINQPSSVKNSRFSSLVYQGSDVLFQISPSFVQDFIIQQQRRHAAGDNPIPLSAHGTVENMLQQKIQDHLLTTPALSSSSTPQNRHLESQKTAEKLAQLKPQVSLQHDPGTSYSQQQRRDMDRFLLQEEAE